MQILGFNIVFEEIKDEEVETKTSDGLIVTGAARPSDYVFDVFVEPEVTVGNTVVGDFKVDGQDLKLALHRDIISILEKN